MAWYIVARSWIGGGQIAGKVDAWSTWLASGIAVFAELQPVVYCDQCALAHTGRFAIA